jgi:hypothetical protein
MQVNKDTSGKNIEEAATPSERNISTLVNTMKDTRGKRTGRPANRSRLTPSVRSEITPDRIRCRAYEIYCDRNEGRGRGGDNVSDWLQAERELTGASPGAPIAHGSGKRHETYDRSEIKPQARGGRLQHA